MIEIPEKPKKFTPQNVFDVLRRKLGHKEAIDIMDGLEGHPEEYQKLVKSLEEEIANKSN